ncbi:glycosyltransferase family 2 protein [Acuticoccus yangtzensis]|uniref:glycosyltransferase family 2 protein n=1 Tax=Acuticoccus yangtzensis TaxID=1443441 RepID=UPI00094993F4|nr:glycosyltransferase family A protein [Acuticoccus yangtzensis]
MPEAAGQAAGGPSTLILCPTHDHADALLMSIASVRAQSVTDWRMVVICDGAPARTVEILQAIEADDPRVTHRVFPKGARYGEAYRDIVLREADEDIVCHLSDDDLWTAGHLGAMHRLLAPDRHGQQADWGRQGVMALPAGADVMRWRFANVGTAAARRVVADMGPLASGLNNVAYRRAAYLALPEGWTDAPEPRPSDVFMWAKFFRAEGLRVAATAEATALKLPSRGKRETLTPTERAATLGPWLARINAPGMVAEEVRKAEVVRGLVALFAFSPIAEARGVDEALALCGLAPAGPDAPFDVALDGAAMTVPMTRRQRRQTEAAFLAVKAAVTLDAAAVAACRAFAEENGKLTRRALRDLATLPPPFPERAARVLGG